MLKDRGNIKWTAMMLPEHVMMLRELKERDSYKTKPIIDEQQLEKFNEIIVCSLETKIPIKIMYYKEHDYQRIIGVVHYFYSNLQSIRIIANDDTDVQICLKNIIDVKYTD